MKYFLENKKKYFDRKKQIGGGRWDVNIYVNREAEDNISQHLS